MRCRSHARRASRVSHLDESRCVLRVDLPAAWFGCASRGRRWWRTAPVSWDGRGVIDAGRDHGAGRAVGCCWSPPVGGHVARVTGAVRRRATRACAIRPIRRPWRRSCSSCATPAIARTACACAALIVVHVARRASDQRGARADRERPRRRSRRDPGAPRQGRQASRGRHGPVGLGAAAPVAWHRVADPRRPAVLRHRRAHARAAAGRRAVAPAPAAHRREGRRAAPLRAASAASRARGRDGARGRAAQRHPAPTRARQPRHHVRLPARASTTPRSSTPSTRGEHR